jgi:hypothetical protein
MGWLAGSGTGGREKEVGPALWAPCYFSKTRTQENRTRAGYNRFDLALDPVVLLNFARPPLIIQAL